jgi:predicted kinase
LPNAYVLVGVPCSGKTTWVNKQDWAGDCAYISTDKFIDQFSAGEGKTYNEVFEQFMPEAVNLMVQEVIVAREQGRDIIWDQTSVTAKSRRKKFNMLPDYEHIAVVFPVPSDQELDQRQKSRPGKIIPQDVVQNMIDTFEMPTVEEGYREIWYAF